VTQNGDCGFWNVSRDDYTTTSGKLAGKKLVSIARKASAALVSSGDEVEFWNLAKWVKRACPVDRSSKVRAIALSPDGARAAIGYAKPLVQVVDVQQRKVLATWDALSGEIRALDFSDDLELVLVGTARGTLHLLGLSRAGEEIGKAQAGTSPIRAVAVAPNRRMFASAADDGKLSVFARDMKPTFTVPMGNIDSLCFLGQKDFAIAVGGSDGTIRIVTVGTGRTVASFQVGRASICSLAASSDPVCLVWGAADGQVGQIGLP
jgi:WD40 repeat protein